MDQPFQNGISVKNSQSSADQKKTDPRDIFDDFLKKKKLFKNKEALSSNFIPDDILYRNKEIETLSRVLAPSLLSERVSNILIYGFSGTGKSLVTKFVGKKLANTAMEKSINVMPIYMNCRLENNNTEYRLMSNLCSVFGAEVPESGLSVNSL